MRRLQLFEFSDLPWWPRRLRFLLTGYLQQVTQLADPFARHEALIAEVMEVSRSSRIVDLCSGAGGPWRAMHPRLEARLGRPISVLLTDRFPDPAAAEQVGDVARVSYCEETVDATALPDGMEGVRVVCDAFHHFPPEQARALVEDAVQSGQPIIVLEMMRRSLADVLQTLRIPLLVWMLVPRLRGLRATDLLMTYVLLIVPLAIAWDGLVSVLRCYTPDELLTLARQTDGGGTYVWKAGSTREGPVSTTFLVGYPRDKARSDRAAP